MHAMSLQIQASESADSVWKRALFCFKPSALGTTEVDGKPEQTGQQVRSCHDVPQLQVQELTDTFISRIDEIVKDKEAQLAAA